MSNTLSDLSKKNLKTEKNSSAIETNDSENIPDYIFKPSSQYSLASRSHIVDKLDLLEPKKFNLTSSTSDRNKISKSSVNFIKKNIEKSEQFHQKLSKISSQDLKDRLQTSLEDSQIKSVHSLDVEERFYKKAEKYEKKKQDLKQRLAEEEVEGCTFKPKTNVKLQRKPTKSEFTKKVDDYVKKKQQNLERAIEKAKKEQQEKIESDPDLTLRPKLCEKSKEILASKPQANMPAHERLYQLKKSHTSQKSLETLEPPDEETEPQPVFFKPQINKKSQDLKRDQPTCFLLYQQASIKKSVSEAPKPKPKVFSENSEKILINKFCKEYNEKIENFEGKPVNYLEFSEVLSQLGFINEDLEEGKEICSSFWNDFKKNEECIELDHLFTALLSVQGLISPEGHDFWAFDEFDAVHKTFEVLYTNRKYFVMSNKADKTQYIDEECTFSPEIIQNSQSLSEKWRMANRSAIRIEDMLAEENKRKQENLEKLKKQIQAEEIKECTFAPKTETLPSIYEPNETDYSKLMNSHSSKTLHKGLALHSYYSVHKEKKEASIASFKELELNKVLEECTFTPVIKNSKGGNIQNFLERMKERETSKETNTGQPGYFMFGKTKKFKSLSDFDPPVAKKVPKKRFY